ARPHQRCQNWTGDRYNQIRAQRHQVLGIFTGLRGIGLVPTPLDLQIAARCPTQFPQSLQHYRSIGLWYAVAGWCGHEYADPTHVLCLLRVRLERPRRSRGATKEREEGAAVYGCSRHSITSSARSKNDSGIVSPIALAVLRLTTSPNLV